MEPSLLSLASDAKKIGLGALIGGLFALLGARLHHKQALNAEYRKRVRDAIEQLSERFEKANVFYLERMAIVEAGQKRPEHTDQSLYEALNMRYRDVSVDLHQLEGRLALLGAIDLASLIESYRRCATAILRADKEMTKAPQRIPEQVAQQVNHCRKRYYELMAKEYKNA